MTFALRYNRFLDAFGGEEQAPAEELPVVLVSPLVGVSSNAWTEFVRRMVVQGVSDVSGSNAVGMFAMMPRRLVDLGLADDLRRGKNAIGRTIYTANFILPMTSRKFLKSPRDQYAAFSASMKDYRTKIANGDIKKDPVMSLSGALGILHRAGPHALTPGKRLRFPDTEALYQRVSGLF